MGPATCTGLGAVSMKVECFQGAPTHSHTQTPYAGTREFMWRRARVALYNRLFARSILTRHHGMGDVFLPWGKGLKNLENCCMKFSNSFFSLVDSLMGPNQHHVILNLVTNLHRYLQISNNFLHIIHRKLKLSRYYTYIL